MRALLAKYELLSVTAWPACTCGECPFKPLPYILARFTVGGLQMVTWWMGLN